MKRKPDDDSESSGSKMPRRDGDNSLNEGGEARHWEQRPGMILEVKMRNFMCHQVCKMFRVSDFLIALLEEHPQPISIC